MAIVLLCLRRLWLYWRVKFLQHAYNIWESEICIEKKSLISSLKNYLPSASAAYSRPSIELGRKITHFHFSISILRKFSSFLRDYETRHFLHHHHHLFVVAVSEDSQYLRCDDDMGRRRRVGVVRWTEHMIRSSPCGREPWAHTVYVFGDVWNLHFPLSLLLRVDFLTLMDSFYK